MRLKEVDWNAPGGAAEVEIKYPDAPIKELVNWLRRTPAWHDNVELVHRKVRKLNDELLAYRNDPDRLYREQRAACLAKARAVKAEKRQAAAR